MKRHELKTDPDVFQAVLEGRKTYEIRKNDRGFAVGDELLLRETRCTGAEIAAGHPLEYSGRELTVGVSHLLTGPVYGLSAGWSILSIQPPKASQVRCLRDEKFDQNLQGPCSAGRCQWPHCYQAPEAGG